MSTTATRSCFTFCTWNRFTLGATRSRPALIAQLEKVRLEHSSPSSSVTFAEGLVSCIPDAEQAEHVQSAERPDDSDAELESPDRSFRDFASRSHRY